MALPLQGPLQNVSNKSQETIDRIDVFSFLWKVGGDSAEIITSSGREFQIRGAVTGKARLPTVVDVTGGTRMRIRDGGAECSTTRHIGDADKWPEVTWCTSM